MSSIVIDGKTREVGTEIDVFNAIKKFSNFKRSTALECPFSQDLFLEWGHGIYPNSEIELSAARKGEPWDLPEEKGKTYLLKATNPYRFDDLGFSFCGPLELEQKIDRPRFPGPGRPTKLSQTMRFSKENRSRRQSCEISCCYRFPKLCIGFRLDTADVSEISAKIEMDLQLISLYDKGGISKNHSLTANLYRNSLGLIKRPFEEVVLHCMKYYGHGVRELDLEVSLPGKGENGVVRGETYALDWSESNDLKVVHFAYVDCCLAVPPQLRDAFGAPKTLKFEQVHAVEFPDFYEKAGVGDKCPSESCLQSVGEKYRGVANEYLANFLSEWLKDKTKI